MKKAVFFMFMAIGITMLTNTACTANNTNSNNNSVATNENVEVYYFHFTRRCATCNAVQDISKEAIVELYGDKVLFADYNLDEEDGEIVGKRLGVSGQTLLIIAGENRIDITTEGFMNARSNPEKLKAIIKEKIDPLLN